MRESGGGWGGVFLALGYGDADKLLYALPILLLSGAAAGVLTWLAQRRLGLAHLLVHPRQTQPGHHGKGRQDGGSESEINMTSSSVSQVLLQAIKLLFTMPKISKNKFSIIHSFPDPHA